MERAQVRFKNFSERSFKSLKNVHTLDHHIHTFLLKLLMNIKHAVSTFLHEQTFEIMNIHYYEITVLMS